MEPETVSEQAKTKDLTDLPVFKDDPGLNHFKVHFEIRQKKFQDILEQINKNEQGLQKFAEGYKKYGFNVVGDSIIYREYAPNAKEMYLTGDFCNWDRKKYKMQKEEFGNWSIQIPGKNTIPHQSKVKTHILNAKNQWKDRIPAWISYSHQEGSGPFDGVFWNPAQRYAFKNQRPAKIRVPKIYECHIGMAGIEPRVHSYKEFTQNVLPRVKDLGYNCVQIMAIAEHAYYGSFGYHVTLPFCVSGRFGTPDDFKELVDTAHGMGIYVLMDIVHSHLSKNQEDGINEWDGTDYIYFHAGEKGKHNLWDSVLYDYSKWETIRYLLSNLSWYTNEYQVDGFRFDGITSMMYMHHGLGFGFTGGYHEYFTEQTDLDSVVYLMLANLLLHSLHPNIITIAEDVSGYPTLCRSIADGGVGFDYRLAMAIPDLWIQYMSKYSDDNWKMGHIVHIMTNRRFKEPVIAYTECHDQALVGDKTLSMWLLDKDIYDNMTIMKQENIVVSRGMALHKMMRLITIGLGGESYLNFMGNEFGHPEWIDFPREGNGWSYHHCRRRFDLADDKLLRYHYWLNFDRAMIHLEDKFQFLTSQENYISEKHEDNKVIVFEKGDLLFVFNFHPTQSYQQYKVGTKFDKEHLIVLDTDEEQFGGQNRLLQGHTHSFPILKSAYSNRPNHFAIYLPCRTAVVFAPIHLVKN